MTTKLVSTTVEPITLDEARRHCRVDDVNTEATAIIDQLRRVAREAAEQITGRSLALSTWDLVLDEFPDDIKLLWPPILTVSQISYLDSEGNPQILDASRYSVDSTSEPGWVLTVPDVDWPDTQEVANAVTVRYTAGYGASCPEPIKQWMLLLVKHLYDNPRMVHVGHISQPNAYVDRLLDRYIVLDR